MSYLSAPIRYAQEALLQKLSPKVSSYFRHSAPCAVRQTASREESLEPWEMLR